MKISIILPTYNEVENIADLIRAIDSVVKDEKEMIVVDDNSPDGTSAAVRSLIETGEIKNIRLITRTKDRGLTNSLKEGIRNARGDIVVWMDCDDIFRGGDKLKEVIANAEANNIDVIYFNYVYQAEIEDLRAQLANAKNEAYEEAAQMLILTGTMMLILVTWQHSWHTFERRKVKSKI